MNSYEGVGRLNSRLNGKMRRKSHIAWFRHYGEWPKGEIDHKDRNPQNNDISNLRIATRAQNMWNTSTHFDNTSGERGVKLDKINHRWQVKVHADKIRIYANCSHKLSAILAARLIRRVLHGEFAT